MPLIAKQFSLKDLGTPSHLLGVELLPSQSGIFMTQHRYIRELLQKASMIDAKPVCTPLSTSCSLSSVGDDSTCDVTSYRSITGSLHYLSITRPNVAVVVNKLTIYEDSYCHPHAGSQASTSLSQVYNIT